MKRDTWKRWLHHAQQRHVVRLIDGRVARLHAVHRYTRSCRVELYGRHYSCWIEQIAFVTTLDITDPRLRDMRSEHWVPLEPWSLHVPDNPRSSIRSHRAAPSKSWLDITPHPDVITALRRS